MSGGKIRLIICQKITKDECAKTPDDNFRRRGHLRGRSVYKPPPGPARFCAMNI
jgi:hypothetical protein